MNRHVYIVAGLLAVLLLPLLAGIAEGQTVVVTRSAPVVTYSYYSPPVVAPAPVVATTYRYGLLGRRSVTYYSYPAPVAAPVVTYYRAPRVVTYYNPPPVVTYYGPVICP
jgi:hypothetical protein